MTNPEYLTVANVPSLLKKNKFTNLELKNYSIKQHKFCTYFFSFDWFSKVIDYFFESNCKSVFYCSVTLSFLTAKTFVKSTTRLDISTFLIFTTPKPIGYAKIRCKKVGGDLVTINSPQEHEFLVKLLK